MSYLDQLKKQAADLQARQEVDQTALARNLGLVEAAAGQVERYLMDLARQLAILRPVSKVAYAFDAKTRFTGGTMTDFQFDARRRKVRDRDVIDHIDFGCVVRGRDPLVIRKDFVPEMRALESRIWQSGSVCEPESIRQAETGHLIEMRYSFVPIVRMTVKVTPQHEEGTLHFRLKNVDDLEIVTCAFQPHEIGQSRQLDEFAHWWLGEPNRFLANARDVRRIEAR